MEKLAVATENGTILHGALFAGTKQADTVMIAITGIHGNFYSNPFYVHLGQTLSAHGIDFVYAQTRNAFNQIPIAKRFTMPLKMPKTKSCFWLKGQDIWICMTKMTMWVKWWIN